MAGPSQVSPEGRRRHRAVNLLLNVFSFALLKLVCEPAFQVSPGSLAPGNSGVLSEVELSLVNNDDGAKLGSPAVAICHGIVLKWLIR